MAGIMYNVHEKHGSHVSEAYRVLKTNLQYYGLNNKMKKLTITSSSEGEGKTSTAINLAISFAKSGARVLVLDADLHKSMLVKKLGSNNSMGLTNFLSGNCSLEEIINPTNMNNFYFIPCGPKPPNPAELIASKLFEELLIELETQFDLIIIDAPPIGNAIDAAIIAAKSDGTLMVIKAGAVNHKTAQMVKEQIEKVGAIFLGVVLNDLKEDYYKIYSSHFQDHGHTSTAFKKGWFKKFKGTGG